MFFGQISIVQEEIKVQIQMSFTDQGFWGCFHKATKSRSK